MRQALELALEALQFALHVGFPESSESQIKKGEKAYQQHRAAITAIKEALAQPEQPKVRTGDCLLVGVCASEGHKIQVKQEPWRESASDYERGVIDGRQMQAQSSVDKAVNRMAQPKQEPVGKLQEPTAERAWFTIAELNAWADKKLAENPNWVMPTEEPERKEALAQEQDNAYIYASNLAKTIWQKHYMKESPKFALLDTTEGVLTQINNMTCGLVREKPAQPEQEPVALQYPQKDIDWQQEQQIKAQASTPPQRTWVGLTDDDEIPWDGVDAKSFAQAIEAKLKEKNT
jgi:hypothetical protein